MSLRPRHYHRVFERMARRNNGFVSAFSVVKRIRRFSTISNAIRRAGLRPCLNRDGWERT